MDRKSVIPIIFMCTGFTLAKTFYGDVGMLRAAVIGAISGIIGTAINQLIDKFFLNSNKKQSTDIDIDTDIEENAAIKKDDDSIMTLPQKIILILGSIVFIMVVAVFPAGYEQPASRTFYSYIHKQNISTIFHVDTGATALRGIAVIGATAALWAIAGKKKTD